MYSPTKAARVTGKSKNTIIKAIQSGRLAARQQKNGRYLITPEQLEQVYPIAGQSEQSPHEVHQGGNGGGENQLDHEVASTASNDPMADRSPDDASFPEQAELMRLRGQLAEVTAGLTLNREQFRSMTDRIAALLERERAGLAKQVEDVVKAAFDQCSDLQKVNSANEVFGDKPGAALSEAAPVDTELAALISEIDEVRTAIHRINAPTSAPQGKLVRVLSGLALGWCMMSGVYVAGFWAEYGTQELVKYGEVSVSALFYLVLSLWPF